MRDNTVIMLMWCNAWDFNIKYFKTHPKISTKTQQFWKTPKFFKKPQILGFKTWNAWIWEIRSLPSKEKIEKAWRNHEEEDWSEWERFGSWKDRRIEREIERNELRNMAVDKNEEIIRPSVNLDRCRCREVSSKLSRWVSRKWLLTDEVVEQVSRNNPPYQAQKLDQST